MSQEITVTKVEGHYEMQFDGGDAYPVPTNAIDKLDDDLTPEEVGESVTFTGDYGGHKHMKKFDVEEVIETPGDDEDDSDEEEVEVEEEVSAGDDEDEESTAEPTDEHVEEVGYNRAAGQAQQTETQQLFGTPETDYSSTGDFDFVCPNCGDDAKDSTEKPYCSKECAKEDLADVGVVSQ